MMTWMPSVRWTPGRFRRSGATRGATWSTLSEQSAAATVALEDDQVVGYQLSTAGPMGGHLARLAVLPHLQGKGLGYALVYHVLDEFTRRGVEHVTVNTQSDNHASQSLYHKSGFWNANEIYQVYQTDLL